MSETTTKKGDISVDTAHIFPIIKKWLYSDKEIFLRELVSNACDAITKQKRLCSLGEIAQDEAPYRIDVTVDPVLGTLTVADNGIGMNDEEIDKYINQIALSGAVDFIEKYEGAGDDAQANGIIGHFGLGFYSAFMIADRVEIKSKTFRDGEAAVHWKGNDDCEFEMSPLPEKTARGTEIILFVNDDEKEFLNGGKVKSVLDKYCAFMPYDIFFHDLGEEKKEEEVKEGEEAAKEAPVNDKEPLWQKKPSDCTPEEYNEFYKKVFHDYKDPLFYIHINAEYPLNFKGILYFPKIAHEYDNMEGQVKLFYNQVFVADNIKEVIPEYMLLLKGVLDCPELPLNVSRSYLQTNGYVNKISQHIVKKIGDKLNSLFNLERETYEGFWDDIKPFVEYGCLRDEKFFDRVKDIALFKTTEGNYVTVKEYAEGEHFDKTIYYTDDATRQSRYISMFKNEGLTVVVLDKLIDQNFISMLEHKLSETEEYKELKFVRVDSGLSGKLKKEDSVEVGEEKQKALTELFRRAIGADDKFKLSCEHLKDHDLPAILNISEQSRRFADMMKMYGGGAGMPMAMPVEETLVLNLTNPLVEKISAKLETSPEDELNTALAKQVYMLALVAQRQLTAEELQNFISDSVSLYDKL